MTSDGDDGGSNVLTPAAFDVAYAVRQGTFDTQFANTPGDDEFVSYFPRPTTYTDVCLTRGGERGADDPAECVWSDVLALFSYDPAEWRSERAILQRLNRPAQWNRTTVGQGFVLESVLGGIQRGSSGEVEGAKALSGTFFLAGNATLERSNDGDEEKHGWCENSRNCRLAASWQSTQLSFGHRQSEHFCMQCRCASWHYVVNWHKYAPHRCAFQLRVQLSVHVHAGRTRGSNLSRRASGHVCHAHKPSLAFGQHSRMCQQTAPTVCL